MRIKKLLPSVLAVFLFGASVLPLAYGEPRSLGEQTYLNIVPLLPTATLHNGYGNIPFKVTNNYSQDVSVLRYLDSEVELRIPTDSGNKITIGQFQTGAFRHIGSGPMTPPTVLKPGESGTFYSNFSMDSLAFVARANKEIMGHVIGCIIGTNETFDSYSKPFAIPQNLTAPPWTDLGTQGFFSVIPDLEKVSTQTGVTEGVLISIPVEIKNVTRQAYIVDNTLTVFYLEKNGWPKERRLGWETIKKAGATVQPGQSVESSGRSYTTSKFLADDGYKSGDKIIAVVGGRVPGTDQVFQCYSASFGLPPLPVK